MSPSFCRASRIAGPTAQAPSRSRRGRGSCPRGRSIIDLSDAGRQPMRDAGSGNVLVFNGELYNYRDLRRELGDGEPWASHSDTEVVLRAWRHWGVDCLPRLRGMFTLALWDASARVLYLARDRFGIKPLYFARRGKSFAFASEVRALMATGIVERRIDPARLGEYLRFQSALGTGAVVEGVGMLGAGGFARVSEDRQVVRGSWIERDGERPAGGQRYSRPEASAPGLVAAAFDDSVRVHLESDVPVGAFLSGGLDSTAIVGTLRHIGVQPKTFTVCWEDGDDESVAARRAAELSGAEHHEVRLSHDEMMTYMRDTLLRDTDQMSMASGLEVRVPFLDGAFAGLVLGMRDEAKFGMRKAE